MPSCHEILQCIYMRNALKRHSVRAGELQALLGSGWAACRAAARRAA